MAMWQETFKKLVGYTFSFYVKKETELASEICTYALFQTHNGQSTKNVLQKELKNSETE
jgi:hypothetical protein